VPEGKNPIDDLVETAQKLAFWRVVGNVGL
jgi:hypothetical protein